MILSIGSKLGPYQIVALIGAGGMGEVYRARDLRLDRDVAIKVSAAQFSERFEREAKSIAALNHPNICTLYDVGPNYLVMEFIEGTPLVGPIELGKALHYAIQICNALGAAHQKGITHRDLKPGNILLTAAGVKLLDFGLAKTSSRASFGANAPTLAVDLTQGTVLGTASYMSPEQAKGEETDARSDIFSFGLVLYEMLSDRRAFLRNSAIETLAAIIRDDPAPLEVPSTVWAIIARCLSKSPAGRFQTITEVRIALEQVTAHATDAAPSIAVLPFANMNHAADDEYFSDGLAEEIINALAQISGLKVIARTSAFAFKGKNEDIRKIGEALGVSNILEGSVRRAGNRLRITAQLIRTTDGTHLWSHRYDREMTDIFAIQDEISAAIASHLKGTLVASSGPKKHVPKVAAYESLLQARHHGFSFSSTGMARAVEHYHQALVIDPEYAKAHSGLAVFLLGTAASGMADPRNVFPKARAAAQRALELDDGLDEAHTVLGVISVQADYNWAEAANHFHRALELEHSTGLSELFYAIWYLRPLGRLEEAFEKLNALRQRDPLSMAARFESAEMLMLMRQYDAAAEIVQQALDLSPTNRFGLMRLIQARLGQKRYDETVMLAEQAAQADRKWIVSLELLACAYAAAGRLDDSRRAFAEMREIGAKNSFLPATPMAAVTVAMGEIETAIGWVETAIEQREPIITILKVWPAFDAIRSHQRYLPLLQKMNLA